MEQKWLYGIIGLLAGSLVTIVVASNAVNSSNFGMMQMMGMRQMGSNDSGQRIMVDNIDRHFIEQMIPHHEDAITMAKLAQTKATRPEIKQLASSIIDSQGKEINQMKAWYKSWFNEEVPIGTQVMSQHGMMGGSLHMGMMGDGTDVARLEQAADFDPAFIEEMIPHLQMAVMMAQMLKNATGREEMEKLADDIISAQTKEINDMREWYKTWGY